jgi:hypothetical protein
MLVVSLFQSFAWDNFCTATRWVDGVRVIVTQPGSRNRNKAASMWAKVNAKRRIEVRPVHV